MAYKILTKNGIDNTNIDGARNEYFNSGMRDGIVQGVLNEGVFSSSSSNVILFDTCELRICGHRIIVNEPVYQTLNNTPNTDTRYSFIAEIIVDDNQNVNFSMFVQSANTPLIQNALYKNINGSGTYQVEIGKFTLTKSLTIEDVVRTIDVITGGTGSQSTSTINIGNVTTQTLSPNVNANVDVSTRYDQTQKKEYIDFNFSIPQGEAIGGVEQITFNPSSVAYTNNVAEIDGSFAFDNSNISGKIKLPIVAGDNVQISTNNDNTAIVVTSNKIISTEYDISSFDVTQITEGKFFDAGYRYCLTLNFDSTVNIEQNRLTLIEVGVISFQTYNMYAMGMFTFYMSGNSTGGMLGTNQTSTKIQKILIYPISTSLSGVRQIQIYCDTTLSGSTYSKIRITQY